MPPRHTRELSAKEKRAIRKLVTSTCATYDPEYECLLLEGTCYMFTIAFNTSGLCKYFRDAVLRELTEEIPICRVSVIV